MGNKVSTANEDDRTSSSDEGEYSDYEHTYRYHKSVLQKISADGFESDYEDDDDSNSHLRYHPVPHASASSESQTAASIVEIKDTIIIQSDAADDAAKFADSLVCDRTRGLDGNPTSAAVATNSGDADQKKTSSEISYQMQRCSSVDSCVIINGAQQDVQNLPVHDVNLQGLNSPAGDACSPLAKQLSTLHSNQETHSLSKRAAAGKQIKSAEVDDAYETAVEGENGSIENIPDDDSLSTITPPRQRPASSESDFSVDLNTDTDDNANVDDVSDSSLESAEFDREQNHKNRHVDNSLSCDKTVVFPEQQNNLHVSQMRGKKRPGSPILFVPTKQKKTMAGSGPPPTKMRFGIFDSESDSDIALDLNSRQFHQTPASAVSVLPTIPIASRETRSMTAKKIRRAAKRAASKFMETSKQLVRDAKTLLKEVVSPTKHSFASNENKVPVPQPHLLGQSSWPEQGPSSKREKRSGRMADDVQNQAHTTRQTVSPPQSSESDRVTELSLPHRTESEAGESALISQPAYQVRKDGEQLRKFTCSSFAATVSASPPRPTASSQLQHPIIRSNSQPGFFIPGSASPPILSSLQAPSPSSPSSPTQGSRTRPGSPPSAGNPFHSITLTPSLTPKKNSSTHSIDSLSAELCGPGQGSSGTSGAYSPFVSLTTDVNSEAPPQPVNTSLSTSVWCRISSQSAQQDCGQSSRRSPASSAQQPPPGSPLVPGPSGQRSSTRSSPRLNPSQTPPPVKPASVSSSLQLCTSPTAQFAHSSRFAFLLEDVLQVTVAASDLTMATTSAVVVTTDSQLRHDTHVSQAVARAAGDELLAECQVYLRDNPRGLQACEIVDMPAGGNLCPLISRVLHVVAPEMVTSSSGDSAKLKKLLLCTYLNCLKHASEKLGLSSLAFPLIGSSVYSVDECIQVFFDSLLVYLAERLPASSLHAVHLIVNSPAVGRFATEVLEARLSAIAGTGIDGAITTVFRDYFNIPDFCRSASSSAVVNASGQLSSGKPAVKRRRL